MFYWYEELRLKTLRKERSNRRLSLLGSIGRIPELFDKKFEQRTVAFSFFYGAGSDRILGNDKREGVPVFTNRKIKTTKSKTRQSDPESLSEKATSYNNISWGDKLYIVYSYFLRPLRVILYLPVTLQF